MSTTLFVLSMALALIGPWLAITYLRPILFQVLRGFCDADGGAEFWIRCAYVLALCGTLLLMLSFGEFREEATAVDTLRRALWLVLAGVFGTVWFITRQVWGQVREVTAARTSLDVFQAARQTETVASSPAWPGDHPQR